MKVTLSRHGGQMAGINLARPPKVIAADTLPAAAKAHLEQLVSAVRAEPTHSATPGLRPDEMSYTITVDDKDGQTALKQSDTTMTDAFRALWEWIEAHPGSA